MLVRECVTMFLLGLCRVSGLGKVLPAIPLLEQQAITAVLLDYLRESGSVINEPGSSMHHVNVCEGLKLSKNMLKRHWQENLLLSSCLCIHGKSCLLNGAYVYFPPWSSGCRQGIESDAQWLESNLGPFSTHATYADLKVFNLSVVSHPFHNQSALTAAAQYSELRISTHMGDLALLKGKDICSSSASSGGSGGLPFSKPEGWADPGSTKWCIGKWNHCKRGLDKLDRVPRWWPAQ